MLVDKDSYLLELSRYIVLNPVRAGLCAAAGDWAWSSYRAVMGKVAAPARLAVGDTLAMFSDDSGAARHAYARFVAGGVGVAIPESKQQIYLGDEAFAERIAHLAQPASTEVPRRQRAVKSLDQYARASQGRDDAIRAAYASGAYTLKAIGDHFGLHYATISRIARRGMSQNKT